MKNWVGLTSMCIILKGPVACFQIHVNKALKRWGVGEVPEGKKADGEGPKTLLTGLQKALLSKCSQEKNLTQAIFPQCDLSTISLGNQLIKIKTFRCD